MSVSRLASLYKAASGGLSCQLARAWIAARTTARSSSSSSSSTSTTSHSSSSSLQSAVPLRRKPPWTYRALSTSAVPPSTSSSPSSTTVRGVRASSSSSSSSSSPSPRSSTDIWMPSLGMYIPDQDKSVDAFTLVSSDLDVMTRSIRETVSVLQHPSLDRAATHLLSLHGKRIRPVIVLLVAHATAAMSHSPSTSTANSTEDSPHGYNIEPTQIRLAEITELIHAASLLHDDVIDVADTRRGSMSVNSMFGNQLAVLAGDFLLARASVALARLRDCEVVELLSTVIEHLVRGEVIQMKNDNNSGHIIGGIGDVSTSTSTSSQQPDNWFYHHSENAFDTYLAKTFFKTASLIANSCRAVTMLVQHSPATSAAAYQFGQGIGIAFQLIDDMLDLTATSSVLGKPVLNDLRQGVITGPVLFAADAFPDIVHPIVQRRCSADGDVDTILDLIDRADGLEKTRQLATTHAQRAVQAIVDAFPPSPHRSALVNLADFVLRRQS